MAKVLIGCKLPSGISLAIDGTEDGERLVLNGMNTSLVAGGYGITSVEQSVADAFFAKYKDFAPVKAKAIFTHGTDKVPDLVDLGTDLEGQKTGLEGLDPNAPAPGLSEVEDAKARRAKTVTGEPPVRAPASAEDKAAAVEVSKRKQSN